MMALDDLPVVAEFGVAVNRRVKIGDDWAEAVNGVDLDIYKGEMLGIVGESGSGKSVSVLSLIQLIPNPPGEVSEGEIFFKGEKS